MPQVQGVLVGQILIDILIAFVNTVLQMNLFDF